MSMRHGLLAAVLVACVGGVAAAREPGDGIVREGEGARRTTLNGRELKPFDQGAWKLLSDWTNGAAMSEGASAGRPVLIATWTDYIPASKRAMALAVKLAEAKAADGLIVVCVHGKDEWASATKPTPPKAGTLLVAHDAKGEFRSAVLSDADPDFYVIDRAGQLRYADIATESVEAAVDRVCKETKDEAAKLNGVIAASAKAAETELKKAEALRSGVDLTSVPELPFPAPSDGAFKGARWPDLPKDPQQQFQGQNGEEKPTAQKATLPDTGWFPSKPTTNGRVTLMYFWHPDVPLSFRDINRFDLLQKQFPRDLVVVGVVSPLQGTDSASGKASDMDPEKLQKKLQDFRSTRPLGHSILVDPQGALFTVSKTYYPSFQQGVPAPWVAIVSSDGMMRWWGWMGFPAYQAALDRCLQEDPGVQARRKVEDEYIKSRQGK